MKINGNLNRILSMLERAREESNKSNRLEPIEDNRFVYSVNVEGHVYVWSVNWMMKRWESQIG